MTTFDRAKAERALNTIYGYAEDAERGLRQHLRAALARIDELQLANHTTECEKRALEVKLAAANARLAEIARIARERYAWNQPGRAAIAAIHALATGKENPNV